MSGGPIAQQWGFIIKKKKDRLKKDKKKNNKPNIKQIVKQMYNQGYQQGSGFGGYRAAQAFYTPRMYHTESSSSISSSIDTIVHRAASAPIQEYNPRKPMQERKETMYTSSPLASFTYSKKVESYFPNQGKKEYHAIEGFLQLYRPKTQFIEAAGDIEDLVKETFRQTTGKELPENIVIRVLEKEEMKAVHEQNGGQWSDTIQGFSINGNPTKQVFVKQADLDKVMIVVGHEIGHVLTPSLGNAHDEEAKAFAFEFAWIEAIMKHNIGNLKANFTLDLKPANNGLHDVASNFVKTVLKMGKEAIEVYGEIAGMVVTLTV